MYNNIKILNLDNLIFKYCFDMEEITE